MRPRLDQVGTRVRAYALAVTSEGLLTRVTKLAETPTAISIGANIVERTGRGFQPSNQVGSHAAAADFPITATTIYDALRLGDAAMRAA